MFGTRGCTTSRQDILSPFEIANLRAIKAAEFRKSCGATATASARAVERQPVPQSGALWHYVTGLNPRGDNFLAL